MKMDIKDVKLVEVDTLKEWLATAKKITVLDIRSDSDRVEWKIPESVHYNVIEHLKSGDEMALDHVEIDKNIPVVTVCTGGNASKIAAAVLTDKGFEAYSLKGGMKAWNYAWDTVEIILGDIKIIQVRRLAKGCLSYVIGSGSEAMVIDASLDPVVYQNIAKENGWSITQVTDTHIHADYVSRTNDLAKATNAARLMINSAKVAYQFAPIKDGEELKVGNTAIKVLHTPGHTWESTSFLIDGIAVFTGDTLFTDGIGRPDLKADAEESIKKASSLYQSLQNLSALKNETLVLAAHISEPIGIGQGLIAAPILELKKSIAALSMLKVVFINSTLANLPDAPPNYLTIAEINKSGDAQDYVFADLEAGANHCAVK
jgi:glyoxylase-like metal-dependent hydrolase (beta-lactamase superfamily II)/rhodanese-related sulfurtransferase